MREVLGALGTLVATIVCSVLVYAVCVIGPFKLSPSVGLAACGAVVVMSMLQYVAGLLTRLSPSSSH